VIVAKPAPHGPLLGNELAWAIELLTDEQLRAYRYFREAHAMEWIGRRLGVTRQAVMQRIVRAERKLGYEPSFTPRQKGPYKSVAQRRAEAESAEDLYLRELLAQVPLADRRRIARILETSSSDEEARRRLGARLKELKRERLREQHNDDSVTEALHRGEHWSTAEFEADFGTNPVTGQTMRPQDFIEDDGKGYDRG
jgi:hypothetical protein